MTFMSSSHRKYEYETAMTVVPTTAVARGGYYMYFTTNFQTVNSQQSIRATDAYVTHDYKHCQCGSFAKVENKSLLFILAERIDIKRESIKSK